MTSIKDPASSKAFPIRAQSWSSQWQLFGTRDSWTKRHLLWSIESHWRYTKDLESAPERFSPVLSKPRDTWTTHKKNHCLLSNYEKVKFTAFLQAGFIRFWTLSAAVLLGLWQSKVKSKIGHQRNKQSRPKWFDIFLCLHERSWKRKVEFHVSVCFSHLDVPFNFSFHWKTTGLLTSFRDQHYPTNVCANAAKVTVAVSLRLNFLNGTNSNNWTEFRPVSEFHKASLIFRRSPFCGGIS